MPPASVFQRLSRGIRPNRAAATVPQARGYGAECRQRRHDDQLARRARSAGSVAAAPAPADRAACRVAGAAGRTPAAPRARTSTSAARVAGGADAEAAVPHGGRMPAASVSVGSAARPPRAGRARRTRAGDARRRPSVSALEAGRAPAGRQAPRAAPGAPAALRRRYAATRRASRRRRSSSGRGQPGGMIEAGEGAGVQIEAARSAPSARAAASRACARARGGGR